jgi:putative acetyltransferase
MIDLKRTNSEDRDFQKLVKLLDQDLAIRDGEDHLFYAQFNKIDLIRHTIVAYDGEFQLLGCGAIKQFDNFSMEVKRMYVAEAARGKGIATAILKELEIWTKDLGFERCILETGKMQPEAIGLYKKNQYTVIENYGQYKGIENSICFEKIIL